MAARATGPNWQRWNIPIALAARPQLINGSWRKPLISRRHLAKLRNEHLENGLPWEEPAANYSVTKVRNPDKPLYKGHKRLRPETIAKRQKMIETKMKEIPAVEKAQKKIRDEYKQRPLKGLELFYVKPARKEVAKIKAKCRGGSGGSAAPEAD